MLALGNFRMAGDNKPAQTQSLPVVARLYCEGGRGSRRRAGLDPRQKWARISLPTACAGSLAQLRSCEDGSSIQSQASSLQNLIANEILEVPVTHSKQTTGTNSNREKFPGPRTKKRAWGVTFGSEAKKRLIATVPNSKFSLTHSKSRVVRFSNRNKKALPVCILFALLRKGRASVSARIGGPFNPLPLWNFQPRRYPLALE